MLKTHTQGESKSLALEEVAEFIKGFAEKYQVVAPQDPDEIKISIYMNIIDHETGQGCEVQFGDIMLIARDILENDRLNSLIIANIIENAIQ